MKLRWCRAGVPFRVDELGMAVISVRQSGWYYMQNHYGQITVHYMPWSFWRGSWEWMKALRRQ